MADYTNYNHGSSSKGTIIALCILAVFIVGILVVAASAPPVETGVVSGNPAAATEAEPTTVAPSVAPAGSD